MSDSSLLFLKFYLIKNIYKYIFFKEILFMLISLLKNKCIFNNWEIS